MTDAERNLVVECLEQYKSNGPAYAGSSERYAMLDNLIERFKAAKVSDAKPSRKPRPKTKPKPLSIPTTSDGTPTVPEALKQIEHIVDMCDEVSEYDSSEAWDFASSVREKTEDIGATIEERNHVTLAQAEALDNMESGISRWIR